MGFLKKVFGNNLPVPKESSLLPNTTTRTAKLLYISDKNPADIRLGPSLNIIIDIFSGHSESFELPPDDPSTIFTKLPIIKPNYPSEVPRPNYFPNYAGLEPNRKWIYLNWLKDVSQEINIGYVFIYYYGLERHLLIGKFDLAFEEILYLRKYHTNKSFLSYSDSALVNSCVFRKRLDILKNLYDSGEIKSSGNTELIIANMLKYDLTAKNCMDIAVHMKDVNKRYIKNNLEIFETELNKVLKKNYGKDRFPLSKYDINRVPRRQDILFANYTFPEEIRTPKLPNFLGYSVFKKEMLKILSEAHENVKVTLREMRKKS